jgi:EEF1A lysine methyltransferase 2
MQIITSCNSTRDELEAEFCGTNDRDSHSRVDDCTQARWRLIDWVKTYSVFRFGGVEGSKVCTVAFQKQQ